MADAFLSPTVETVDSLSSTRRINRKLAICSEVLRLYCFLVGYTYKVTSAYRSNAEQDALYAQGRTKPGSKVTNARGGQSKHNPGPDGLCRAIDIYCTD